MHKCFVKNGYPPQYTPEVFREVMEQVENFKENDSDAIEPVSVKMYTENKVVLSIAAQDRSEYKYN